MKTEFHGNSLENCIKAAVRELNIKEEDLKYRIVDNGKGFFKKKFSIQVETYSGRGKEKADKSNGTIKAVNGNIIVKDPLNGGKPAVIEKSGNMKLMIDGTEVSGGKEVFKSNEIKVIFEESGAERQLNVYVSDDKMEAYADIIYKPRILYKLKDEEEEKGKLILMPVVSQKIYPPRYTEENIKEELSKNNVVYGIIEENLQKLIESNNKKMLVAKGKKVVNDEDDFVDIKFETTSSYKQDEIGNIDFKSIGLVNSVKKNQVIAVRHYGKNGSDGFNVMGNVIKHKKGKKVRLKAGAGCVMKDENTVVAAIDGKPSCRGAVFYVNQVHELNDDVDLKTGNICFLGDITVHGSIKEGMAVDCGNNLLVDRNVEKSKLNARGNIVIKGNIVGSKICGGGEDVRKIKSVEHLENFCRSMRDMVDAVNEIKTYNLFGQGRRDGEIIKILMENKFKNIIKFCINIISDLNMQSEIDNNQEADKLVSLIRSKLIGMAPVNIADYSELDEIIELADSRMKEIKNELKLPVKVVIAYCQDSTIDSSGDIIITDRGEYISNITANSSIEFLQEKSVARGGYLKAKDKVKCRIVGSVAGVKTKIEVERGGNIWADIAYHNTSFKVGTREYVLDSPSKNVHAYLKDGNIVVDKLVL